MNELNPKEFVSLSEFKKLVELPETKALSLVDNEGIIKYCNKTFENLFLLKENDSFVQLDSEPNISSLIRNLIQSKYASFHFDLFVFQTENIPFSSYVVDLDRILIDGKELFLLIFTSNEEKKELEEKINSLHNALDYGDVAVIITDENGLINYVSKAFEKILHKGIENLYNQPIVDELSKFLSKSDIKEFNFSLENKVECIKIISSVNKEGEIWFKELKFYPVRRSESENLKFILTANDITNYILKNRVIQNSEQQQKTIINNISDPLVILKRVKEKYLIENVNESFITEFKIDKENSIGNEIEFIFPEYFYIQIIDKLDNYNEERNSKNYYTCKTNGRDYQIKISTVADEYSDAKFFIVSLNDITEQLQNEKILKAAYEKEIKLNKLKTAFLANMSHEIRTPLNAIVGYADLLEDDILNKEFDNVTEMTGFLRDGVNRLLNLVDNILEVAKLESGENDLDFEICSVNAVLSTYFDNLKQKLNERNIGVDFRFDENNPQINIDESKFRKIMLEVIDNAIKYNKNDGKILATTSINEGKVNIEIIDTGIGIRQEKLDQILEPFLQDTDEGYKRRYEGAGLGLTIANKLTLILGGKLEVTSAENIGTKVTLTFTSAN